MMVLPAELVEQIIDHLADDPLALLSCSSVARLWRLRALIYLFRSIRIHQTQLARSFGCGAVSLTPAEFHELRTTAPYLLLYVRDVAVSVENRSQPFDELLHFVRSASFPAPFAVTTFRISSPDGVGWGEQPFRDFSTRFPVLQRVELNTQVLLHLSDIADVLAVARELVMHAPNIHQESMPPYIMGLFPEEPPAIPNLCSLELVDRAIRPNRNFYYYVSRLHVCAPNRPRIALRGLLLHMLCASMVAAEPLRGTNICEITMHANTTTPLAPRMLEMLLNFFPHLLTLEFEVRQESFASVALPTPPAHRSMTVRFNYRGLAYGYLASLPPAEWDAWTAASPGARLSFVFVIIGRIAEGWCAKMEEQLKVRFPTAYSTGHLDWRVADKSML